MSIGSEAAIRTGSGNATVAAHHIDYCHTDYRRIGCYREGIDPEAGTDSEEDTGPVEGTGSMEGTGLIGGIGFEEDIGSVAEDSCHRRDRRGRHSNLDLTW